MPASTTDPQPVPNIDVTNPYTPRRPAPIVSISINHPIARALRKIKNFLTHKQTLFSTSFTIKITPIVALVSFFGVAALFGGGITTAFTFGKSVEQRFLASIPSPTPKIIISTPVPAPVIVSRAGMIKATYQTPFANPSVTPDIPIVITNQSSASGEITPTAKPTPIPTSPVVLHYILVSRSGSIVFLINSNNIHLQNYLNTRVLVTGALDSTKNTLTLTKPEDIEVLQ